MSLRNKCLPGEEHRRWLKMGGNPKGQSCGVSVNWFHKKKINSNTFLSRDFSGVRTHLFLRQLLSNVCGYMKRLLGNVHTSVPWHLCQIRRSPSVPTLTTVLQNNISYTIEHSFFMFPTTLIIRFSCFLIITALPCVFNTGFK